MDILLAATKMVGLPWLGPPRVNLAMEAHIVKIGRFVR
jgi:hypothetical protein